MKIAQVWLVAPSLPSVASGTATFVVSLQYSLLVLPDPELLFAAGPQKHTTYSPQKGLPLKTQLGSTFSQTVLQWGLPSVPPALPVDDICNISSCKS